jgi:hypothetical protein
MMDLTALGVDGLRRVARGLSWVEGEGKRRDNVVADWGDRRHKDASKARFNRARRDSCGVS